MSDPPPSFPRKRESSGVGIPDPLAPDPLRADAEARLADHPPEPPLPNAEELLHELQVHQIELEMQNEALRHAQIALEESRDRYLDLYEFAPVGYLSLNPSGQITACNLTCAAMLGMGRARLIGRRFAGLAVPEDRDRWHETMAILVRRQERRHCELALLRPDGSRLQVRLDCLARPGDEQGPDLRLTLTDINREVQAEQALAEQVRLLGAITEHSPDAIYVLDREHRLRFLNPVALALIRSERGQPDLAPEALQGLHTQEVFGDTPLTRSFIALDEEAMAQGRSLSHEDEVGPPGSARIRLIVRTPLRDSAGRITGLIGIARDITDRKRAEAERLEALKRQRDALVREVHHRIKNSLQSVVGLLQRELGRFLELDPRLQAAITQVNAIAVVHGLQGATPAETIRFCDTVAQICRNLQTQTGRTLDWRIEQTACAFQPVQLHRDEAVAVALVVNELVLNAVKHGLAEGPPVQVSLCADGGSAHLRIRNRAAFRTDFDLAAGRGLNTGLNLVRALLPEQGAQLTYAWGEEDDLSTELVLTEPVVLPLA